MGCDIHPAIQVNEAGSRDGASPVWINRMVPNDNRNYLFFGTLAGIRNDTLKCIVPQRGYPPHSGEQENEWTSPSNLLKWVDGEHSASYFTLAEAKAYVKNYLCERAPEEVLDLDIDVDTFAALCERWLSWIEDMEYCKKFFWLPEYATDDNVRVVFNFDS